MRDKEKKGARGKEEIKEGEIRKEIGREGRKEPRREEVGREVKQKGW